MTSLIDEVQVRSGNLSSMIALSITHADLAHLYNNGVPSVHVDWFRYFLLAMLKSYRVLRQFSSVKADVAYSLKVW